MAPTKFLDSVVETATKTASEKYADAAQFGRYLLSSHPQTPNTGFVQGLPETMRHFLFGDPLTFHQEAQKSIGNALKRTFLPMNADGSVAKVPLALGYGVPAALTALQYRSIPEEERPYHRGSLVGGAIGGTLGGTLGSRFGAPGQFILAPAAQRFGTWVGSHFDKQRPEPAHYQVNSVPGTLPPAAPDLKGSEGASNT